MIKKKKKQLKGIININEGRNQFLNLMLNRSHSMNDNDFCKKEYINK